jgi:hypothetical protein
METAVTHDAEARAEKKRKTKDWVPRPVPAERRELLFKGLKEYCARFWKRSIRARTIICIAGLQRNVARPNFSDVWAAFSYLNWDTERVTPRQVQDAIYEFASEKQGNLFEMGLDEGETLVLWSEVIQYLDTLHSRTNPVPPLKEKFASKPKQVAEGGPEEGEAALVKNG